MRITVIAMGTRGDVQPLLALARGLQAAGHKVLFATEASYSQAVKNENLEFYKLSGNSEAFNSGRGGKLFRDSIEKPTTKYARFWKTYVAPAVRVHLLEAAAPCQGADVLLCQPQLMIGPSLAEKFGLASVITGLFPVAELPTREFPFPLYNGARADLSPEENCRSWRRAIPVLRVGHEAVQQWRVEVLGLRAQTFRESLECIQETPHLLGYSNLVVPKPSEWNDRVEVAGYWFLGSAACYTPPPELEQFLAAGEPPVVIGFGSHVGSNARELADLVLDALASAGRRGILITGWGGLKGAKISKTIFSSQGIPYDWLLPQASALVHHGGSGTTAIALRVGLPQVIIPFGWDQTFWAHRIAKLGVGAKPVTAPSITAEQLAEAINEVTTNENIRSTARHFGELIRSERGVEGAVKAIERFARVPTGITSS